MSTIHDPNDLVCPACGTHNAQGICGTKLLNPVGCNETLIVIKCSGCSAIYLEIEEDGFSHPDGPDYWTRGPFDESQGYEIIGRIQVCPDRFNRLCSCPSHKFMEDLMYGEFFGGSAATSVSNGEQPDDPAQERPVSRLAPVIATLNRLGIPEAGGDGVAANKPVENAASVEEPGPPGDDTVLGAGAPGPNAQSKTLEEQAADFKANLEESVPGAAVEVMVKSMAWARRKLGLER